MPAQQKGPAIGGWRAGRFAGSRTFRSGSGGFAGFSVESCSILVGKSARDASQACAAAAFVSSAKSQCIHPERKDPYLCGALSLETCNKLCALSGATVQVATALGTALPASRRTTRPVSRLPQSLYSRPRRCVPLQLSSHQQSHSASTPRGRTPISVGSSVYGLAQSLIRGGDCPRNG